MTRTVPGAAHGDGLVPALEIGGSHVTAALVDLDADGGPVVRDAKRADLIAAEPADLIVQRIAACAATVAAPLGSTWGVAVPGPFDYTRGIGLFTDVGKFDTLHGVDLRQLLLPRLPSRPADIIFLNDAEAFLRGEWTTGAARGHDRAVGLTLGTGIGSAFLAQGRPVTAGPQVPPSGSVHLLTVNGSPLEDVVSSRAIKRRYAAATGVMDVDVRGVAQRASAGEPAARDVFHAAFTALGQALAPWLRRFQASVLVVGGSIARSWDLVEDPLNAGIRSQWAAATGLCVVPAERPEQAPLIGAAWQALHHPSPSGTTRYRHGSEQSHL